MDTDNRRHSRFNPKGLLANIILSPHSLEKETTYEGTVVDLSYTGIKIKLNTPLNKGIDESEILIKLTMPESGIPITIRGVLKHLTTNSECGLQYINQEEHEIDGLMFECIKIAHNHDQHNTEDLITPSKTG